MNADEQRTLVDYIAQTNHESRRRGIRLGVTQRRLWTTVPGAGQTYVIHDGRYLRKTCGQWKTVPASQVPWVADPTRYGHRGTQLLESHDLDAWDDLPPVFRRQALAQAMAIVDVVTEGSLGIGRMVTRADIGSMVESICRITNDGSSRARRLACDNVQDILDALGIKYTMERGLAQ